MLCVLVVGYLLHDGFHHFNEEVSDMIVLLVPIVLESSFPCVACGSHLGVDLLLYLDVDLICWCESLLNEW